MKVVRVAETWLSVNEDGQWNIEQTGYRLHGKVRGQVVAEIDELGEAAGRGCYHSWDRPNPETATNQGYLANIIKQSHFSVLEHGCVTYFLSGVSRNLLLELERHRHLSYSVVSTRYVDMSGAELVVPPAIRDLTDTARDAVMFMWGRVHGNAIEAYRATYKILIDVGCSRKQAREAARDILPGGIETDLLVTGNVRAWREVIQKRYAEGAAQDIQELAKAILTDLKELCPNSVQDLELK